MEKSHIYALTKKKLTVLAVAVLAAQATFFASGYVLSLVLHPEQQLATVQPCATVATTPAAKPQVAVNTPAAGAVTAPEAQAPAPSTVPAVPNPAAPAVAAVAVPAVVSAPVQAAAVAPTGPAGAAPSAAAAAGQASGAAPAATGSSAAVLAALKAAEATPDNPGVGPAVCEGTSELVHNDANLPRKYSVQIGAFLDASNALRLAGDFKAKGYKPCLMKASDRQGRRWTVVRMGEFENVSSASMYAHSITGREQVVALVRPSDSF